MSRRICRYYSINRIIPINRGEKIQKLKGEKMRTQQEIKKMKDDIVREINKYHECMDRANNMETFRGLSDRKRQLMAQYNILLEVLK